jgi:hypothetical protein
MDRWLDNKCAIICYSGIFILTNSKFRPVMYTTDPSEVSLWSSGIYPANPDLKVIKGNKKPRQHYLQLRGRKVPGVI